MTTITLEGKEYEVILKPVETYTPEELKKQKIAVECTEWEQAYRLGKACFPDFDAWKTSNDHYLGGTFYFIAPDMHPGWTKREEWLTESGFTKTIPFSQVKFEEKKEEKTPLFVTEDGVEVFDGEDYFFVDLADDEKVYQHYTFEVVPSFSKTAKRFKHRENAEKYISDNRPKYSKREILEALDAAYDEHSCHHNIYDLVNRIKTKLGL